MTVVYREDGKECNCNPEQLDEMLAAGYTLEKPEVKKKEDGEGGEGGEGNKTPKVPAK